MKNILFILYFIIYSCTPAFGAATTTITADSIRSSNRTKTWTPPSITDVLTGLTDVQTLTNKTLTSPTINTPLVDVDTFTEQGSTPSTPAAGKRKVYAKADGIYHLDSAGNERKVGSGSGGGDVSYIINGNADDANASIFVPYADAAATRPVDGTGGSPTVTTSITSTVPLVGTKSYLLTKPASNVQGQGWAIPFTVDLGYRAKASKITIQYIVNSGTFVAGSTSTESDVIWYLYDVTNSVLIEPSNIKMFASSTTLSDQYEAEFQTSSSGASYRLIAHVASTSASAYELKVDNISVSPSRYVYAAPITAWKKVATPPNIIGSSSGTLVVGTGGGAEYTMAYRQVGENTEVEYAFRRGTSGFTDISGVYVFPYPPGITPHADVLSFDTAGYGEITAVVSANPLARLVGKFFGGGIIFDNGDSTLLSNGGALASNANRLTFKASFKTAGLSATTQQSDGYDASPVQLEVTGTPTGTFSNTPTTLNFPTVVTDTSSCYSAGACTIKTAGFYTIIVSGNATSTVSQGNAIGARIMKNGTQLVFPFIRQAATLTTASYGMHASIQTYLVAGDVITTQAYTDGSSNSLAGSAWIFSIKKDQAPTTMSATEEVSASYSISNAPSIPHNTDTLLVPNVKNNDTHGSIISTSDGKIRLPRSGRANISASVQFQSFGAVSSLILFVYKNGVPYKTGSKVVSSAMNTSWSPGPLSLTIEGTTSDYFEIKVFQNSGSSRSLTASAVDNYIDIYMIK